MGTHTGPIRVMALHALAYCERLFYLEEIEEIRVADERVYDGRTLHDALDEAVAAAYGWPASAAHDPADSNRRLLELNREIAAGRVPYHPFD